MTRPAKQRIDDPLAPLRHSGEWAVVAGEARLGPRMSAVVNLLDSAFLALALKAGASPWPVPASIERSVLERAGYFESFSASRIVDVSVRCCLPPATCYHCYAKLASARLDEPHAWTCVARCCRNETGGHLGRLRSFTMREIVLVGSPAWVRQARQQWMDRMAAFAGSMKLRVRLEPATDPFFGGENRGKRLLQQLKELKYELNAQVDGERRPLAISSFNLHEAFFSRRFGFGLADGSEAHTGCVAFGLERWALALVLELGTEAAFKLINQECR
jgi:hypothetical protein